ncbi:MAG: PRC-barrel domain-containing protein [Sporichthyaceae bacterium]|jgi:uncharacterized protein YrrD
MIGRRPEAPERIGGMVRATGLVGLPVVTLGGDRVAEVKDVVFDRSAGAIRGFTLNNPKLFSRTRHDALAIAQVRGVGDAAVMVDGDVSPIPAEEVAPAAEREHADVLSDTVLTDAGVELGTVRDVIVDLTASPPDVVGYEIEPGPALPSHGRLVLIPVPATLAVSGERLMLPAAVTEYVADDLASFGAAVTAFRSAAGGSLTPGQVPGGELEAEKSP